MNWKDNFWPAVCEHFGLEATGEDVRYVFFVLFHQLVLRDLCVAQIALWSESSPKRVKRDYAIGLRVAKRFLNLTRVQELDLCSMRQYYVTVHEVDEHPQEKVFSGEAARLGSFRTQKP